MSAPPLEERVRSSGYTPRTRDLDALFALLSFADDDLAKDTERSLSRLGALAAEHAVTRFDGAEPPLRSRLCALVGRVATELGAKAETKWVDWLLVRLSDGDPKTRRRAVRALGKLGGARVEMALVAALRDDVAAPDGRALALALGNVGGERALERLETLETDDPELERIVREARMKLSRATLRREPGSIDASRAPARPIPVLLHVRAGLEELLLDELGSSRRTRTAGRGRVEVWLDEPLDRLFRARTFLDLGFPLESEVVHDGDSVGAVVRAIASDAAMEIFTAFTSGPIRYRLEWASAGRRRSATFRVAERVAALRPTLVNDATLAPWEVVVSEKTGTEGARVFVELWPRALEDPRFAYRRRTLPASSHPTIAAALARVAGVVPDDVVWDPFVGAGGELVERALLGPYAKLYGTDNDPRALEAARDNLRASGVERWELAEGDARRFRPSERPSLIVTNPPFGKRVRGPDDTLSLLDATLAHAARVLRPSGRVVWISPLGAKTAESARRHGFSVKLRRDVDVGGVRGEMQVLVVSGSESRSSRET